MPRPHPNLDSDEKLTEPHVWITPPNLFNLSKDLRNPIWVTHPPSPFSDGSSRSPVQPQDVVQPAQERGGGRAVVFAHKNMRRPTVIHADSVAHRERA